jgi:hypothetical protein
VSPAQIPASVRGAGRRRLRVAVALAALAVAGCADLFAPRAIEVPEARLQELVARRFPVSRRLADAVELTVGTPRLTLQPEANRIGVELAVSAGGEGAARVTGSLLVSQGLRLETSDHTVRIADVRVDRFAVDGLPAGLQRLLDRLGKPLAQALLEDQVLYAMRPEDVARLEGRGVRPEALRVTASGLTITLRPVER